MTGSMTRSECTRKLVQASLYFNSTPSLPNSVRTTSRSPGLTTSSPINSRRTVQRCACTQAVHESKAAAPAGSILWLSLANTLGTAHGSPKLQGGTRHADVDRFGILVCQPLSNYTWAKQHEWYGIGPNQKAGYHMLSRLAMPPNQDYSDCLKLYWSP